MISFVLPRSMWSTNWIFSPSILLADSPKLFEIIIPYFGELDFWLGHRSFCHTWDGIWEDVNFCIVHFREFIRKDYLSHELFFLCGSEMKYQNAGGFPLHSERRAFLQEDPSCLGYNETRNYSIVSRSSDHPKRNLLSILLMRILTWDIAWDFAKVPSERKVCEKSWGRHSTKSSDLSKSEQWISLHRGEYSLCQLKRQLIACSHVFYQKKNDQKFTLSNNPSKSTLCVLVTCLRFGLRPLLIIWITAALSSKR